MANSVWEADTGGLVRPSPDSSADEKRRWVQSKYAARAFVAADTPLQVAVEQLHAAVRTRDVVGVVRAVASGDAASLTVMLSAALEHNDAALVQMLAWAGATKPRDDDVMSLIDLLKSCGCSSLI